MNFDNIAKYSGFVLTVVSLIIGLDYFLHDRKLSLEITAVCIIISVALYLKFNKKDAITFDLKVLTHEVEIDLQDVNGDLAIHSRKTKFLCLKNGVSSFTDHMSADGEFSEPKVHPGIIEEIRKEGGDLFVKSNFGHVLKKGESIDKKITAKLKNSFNNQPEYWSVRIILPTEEFKLTVIFHRDRPYRSFRGYRRVTSHETLTEIQPVETLISGRPALIWTVKNPVIKDVYKLLWDW
ncbi:hypothetical protein ABDD95_18625 [Mucilaginibacter sp. PAMB04274]|uniref:hypothetical protein n=1 Tax=Mucilaginibacter sp. PAMB04274 TaxID=3138568 RepID=UPI0031F683BB